MLTKLKNKNSWTGIQPWVLIGAVVVLLPIFTFITVENINRQKKKSIHLILEKGAALIRSFEAGTRTGMMGMHRGGFQLQQLLTEMARQPDIIYLFVADSSGNILAHNNLEKVGTQVEKDLDPAGIVQTDRLHWRQVTIPDGDRVFEVFRKFTPTRRPMGRMHSSMTMGRGFEQQQNQRRRLPGPLDESARVIFVGLDMTPIIEAQDADIRHAVIMGVVLLLVGFAGIALIFLVQSNRVTKASLTRIKAFSDNVVENMPIGLIALDDRHRIATCNHIAESVLQLSASYVMGKNAAQMLPIRLWEVVKRFDELDHVIEEDIDCTLADGSVIPLEIGASILQDANGVFLGYILLFKDLTEVRSLRREIDKNQRLASLGRLAAGVAHEIRNPLSSIKGFATYFKERYPDTPQDQKTANIMIAEVDRLNRVVGQLLEFARPVPVSPKSTSLQDLVDDSVRLIEQKVKEKQITVKTLNSVKVDKAVIDPDRINQVLLNLYLNAIESMEPGGELGVELSADEENHRIEIRVSDTGCGIPGKHLSRIFDPYFTTKSTGTGLGLAIAHNVMEAMGGKIDISSRPGKGTTFCVTIPISHNSLRQIEGHDTQPGQTGNNK
jgi:two-component system sensor histidine kinase HydH